MTEPKIQKIKSFKDSSNLTDGKKYYYIENDKTFGKSTTVKFLLDINKYHYKNKRRVLDNQGREWVLGLWNRGSLKTTYDKQRKERGEVF